MVCLCRCIARAHRDAGTRHDSGNVEVSRTRCTGWCCYGGWRKRWLGGPHLSRYPRLGCNSAHIRAVVLRAQADWRRVPCLPWHWVASHQARSLGYCWRNSSLFGQALRRWRFFQSVKPQDRNLLFRLSPAVRFADGTESNAHNIGTWSCVRCAYVPNQGAGGYLCRCSLCVAALPSERSHLGVPLLWHNFARAWRETSV